MATAKELLDILYERVLQGDGRVEAVSVIATSQTGSLYRYTIDKDGLWIVEPVRRTRAAPTFSQ